MPYIGGEVATAQVWQPGYQFFYVALFFTVVHVAALVLATSPPDATPLGAPSGYLIIMAVCGNGPEVGAVRTGGVRGQTGTSGGRPVRARYCWTTPGGSDPIRGFIFFLRR